MCVETRHVVVANVEGRRVRRDVVVVVSGNGLHLVVCSWDAAAPIA